MILSNKIECKKCHSIIESLHRHDYKSCKCGRVAVDGGREYLKRSYKKITDFVDLSVILYEPKRKEMKHHAKRT